MDEEANTTMNNGTSAMMKNEDMTGAKFPVVTLPRMPCWVW
jgi:hypothetical protein